MREWLIDLEIKQIKEFIQKMFKHYIQELFKHLKTKTPSKRNKKAATGNQVPRRLIWIFMAANQFC